jgi:integrase
MGKSPPGADPPSPRPRRAKGDGSLFQRKDGKWIASVDLPGEGKRRRVTRICATERAARAALKELRAQAERGRPLPDPQRTLGPFLAEWLAATVPRLAPETAHGWATTIRLHITPEIGRVPLVALTPMQVQRWLTRLDARGIGPWARVRAHAVLRTALNDALRWGYVTLNAAALAKAPPLPRIRPTILTPEQGRALLGAVAGTTWEPILHLALYAALRQGEILALRWGDVDLAAGTVTVSATLSRDKARERRTPKTTSSARTVPLAGPVLTVLRAHRQRETDAGRFPHADAFLFIEPRNGRPLAASKLSHGWSQLLQLVGLPHMHFHHTRSTSLSWMSAAGVSPAALAAIAGHRSTSTTLGYYVRAQAPEQRAAVEALARVLAEPEPGAKQSPGG